MQCPECKKEGVKYLEKKKRLTGKGKQKVIPRNNFQAKCKKCKWEGVI